MSSTVEQYLRLVDILRESRRSTRWVPEQDRPLLAHLEDLDEELGDGERDVVETAGWRAWPEMYDARIGALANFIELFLDAADDGRSTDLPRQPAAA